MKIRNMIYSLPLLFSCSMPFLHEYKCSYQKESITIQDRIEKKVLTAYCIPNNNMFNRSDGRSLYIIMRLIEKERAEDVPWIVLARGEYHYDTDRDGKEDGTVKWQHEIPPPE